MRFEASLERKDVNHCDRIAANTEAPIAPQKPIGWCMLNRFLDTRKLDLSSEVQRHWHSLSVTNQINAGKNLYIKPMEIEIAESAFRHVTCNTQTTSSGQNGWVFRPNVCCITQIEARTRVCDDSVIYSVISYVYRPFLFHTVYTRRPDC